VAAIDDTLQAIKDAEDWNTRVARIRQIPQKHGTADHAAIYAAVAQAIYVPHLAPDFAYVHWRDDYELEDFRAAYELAARGTHGFTEVETNDLARTMRDHPRSLRVFRVLLGFTTQEFAASTKLTAEEHRTPALSNGRVKSIEAGAAASEGEAALAALTVHLIMNGELFEEPTGTLRRKVDKPDTARGWASVQTFAREGVPFDVFLHQRHYGGPFRQLLDATSTQRGDIIENAVAELFDGNGVHYIRTGAHNQADIEEKFEVAVRPAPDFVVYDDSDALRAMLECKGANDGGTARDKALRYVKLREESIRLNGTPLFAVLSGLGWTRVNDTLGPVVRDCDGRVFTLANLDDMLTVQPFPQLIG
jgi:hypothetical protein